MKTTSTLSRFAIAAAFSVWATAAMAGAIPAVDGYVCQKVKDLKTPAALVTTPSESSVLTILSLSNDCTIGKLAQFCFPASENGSTINQPFVGQCCFKVKCAEETETQFSVSDIGNGAPTLAGTILSSRKNRTLCIPCNLFPPI
jgi:hypothetical protein